MTDHNFTTISTVYDSERGCGWRRPGGMYLMADGLMAPCGRMPLSLTVCSHCGHGIKPSRGWSWLELPGVLKEALPTECNTRAHDGCSAYCPLYPHCVEQKAGLLWCGEVFYKTPQDWIREAQAQGVSRRISQVPKGLVLGETWVLMAHRKAVMGVNDAGEIVYTPGIIHAFKPQRIEYVVTGDETEKQLTDMQRRGITPVRVERLNTQAVLL